LKINKVTVSAPGKLMLFGEHAVVYGHPCIVTAVDQRMFVTAEVNDSGNFELEAPDVKVSAYKRPLSEIGIGEIPMGAQFVETAIANVVIKYKKSLTGLKVITRSEFSSQFGFGSSSASTVCMVKALSELLGLKLKEKEIFDIAFRTVLDIQGKGSGFDVAAGVYGGTLYFVTPGKTIEKLKIKTLPLIVGYSGVKADTVTLINKVSDTAKDYPRVINGIYDIVGVIVNEAKPYVVKENFEELGRLMNLNQGLLETLLHLHPWLKEQIECPLESKYVQDP
jgi:mevalonate kinase